MNTFIAQTSGAILSLYESRKNEFAECSKAKLNDILHECSTVRDHSDFSVRTAAEINRAAALMALEERG